MICSALGGATYVHKTCKKWFHRFRNGNGDFYLSDRETSGQPKKFKDEELEELLEENRTQTKKRTCTRSRSYSASKFSSLVLTWKNSKGGSMGPACAKAPN